MRFCRVCKFENSVEGDVCSRECGRFDKLVGVLIEIKYQIGRLEK